MPRLQQIEQQNDGKSDAEGRGKDAYWLCSQRIFESVSKKVKANEQEKQCEEAGQPPKSSCQPSANDQWLGVVRRSPDEGFCAHGSHLARAVSSGDGILDTQKLEIGQVRGRVLFLHRCAAYAARIATFDVAV
jgi:hypothetical protein